MKKAKIEERVRQAFTNAAPDQFDSVLADCREKKGSAIMFEEKRKNKHLFRYAAGIAAALVLVVGSVFGVGSYRANYAVDSTISLDVNPSIEIQVNRNEKVLDVIPLNSDGVTVLGDMDLKGTDLEVTVNALVGSMLKNGYISDIANSILVSVDNSDPQKSAQLQEKLTTEISQLLNNTTFSGAVLSQTIVPDDQVQTLADQYGITPGKAQLIQQIIAQDSRYTFETLAPLTINELNLIADSGQLPLGQISSTGHASSKGYIGEDAAREAALTHAGLDAAAITGFTCEMDYDHSRMVYEIEFTCGGLEYDYDIDALTGEMLGCHKEADHDHGEGHTPAGVEAMDQQAAINAALSHAGITASDAAGIKCEPDDKDGKPVYEIEFTCGGYEYDYEIDACSGDVLRHEKEHHDDDRHDDHHDGHHSTQSSQSVIGDAAAKNAALTHAGISAAQAAQLECKLETENGITFYEVEFKCGGYEYDYEIDAASGAVLRSSKEID